MFAEYNLFLSSHLGRVPAGILSMNNKTYGYDQDLLQEQWSHKGI